MPKKYDAEFKPPWPNRSPGSGRQPARRVEKRPRREICALRQPAKSLVEATPLPYGLVTGRGVRMSRPWEADPEASFVRRLGKHPLELGATSSTPDCPDIWELSNGDVAFIGRDLTESYRGSLPPGVSVGSDERLVVLPGRMLRAAKSDILDAD